MTLKFAALALTLSTAASASAQLPQVIAKLNATSKTFTSAQADVHYDIASKVPGVGIDNTIQTGKVYIERSGKSESMGAVLTNEGSAKPTQILAYDGAKFHSYVFGTNTDDVLSAGGNKTKYESFLTLGFGGSGDELQANWNITDQGTETINGVRCEKLDLVGKDDAVRKTFSHITLWMDLNRGISLRQIAYGLSGESKTADYTNIVLGKKPNKSAFAIPKGAQVNQH